MSSNCTYVLKDFGASTAHHSRSGRHIWLHCCRLLEADERNFHAWGYRQFLMDLMQAAPEDEEAYAAAKIDKNFSNYSAWHLKTRLLKKVHHQSPTVTLDDLLNAKPSGSFPIIQTAHQQLLCWEMLGLLRLYYHHRPTRLISALCPTLHDAYHHCCHCLDQSMPLSLVISTCTWLTA